MNYRIKQYKQGWIVEERICKWHLFFGIIKKWKHVTHWSGMPENPFYYKTPEKAREGALDKIKDEINYSFFFP